MAKASLEGPSDPSDAPKGPPQDPTHPSDPPPGSVPGLEDAPEPITASEPSLEAAAEPVLAAPEAASGERLCSRSLAPWNPVHGKACHGGHPGCS